MNVRGLKIITKASVLWGEGSTIPLISRKLAAHNRMSTQRQIIRGTNAFDSIVLAVKTFIKDYKGTNSDAMYTFMF